MSASHFRAPRLAPFASYIVIPARLASTRLPRKLLLDETGKPLIQHTYEAARRAKRPRGTVRGDRPRGNCRAPCGPLAAKCE